MSTMRDYLLNIRYLLRSYLLNIRGILDKRIRISIKGTLEFNYLFDN